MISSHGLRGKRFWAIAMKRDSSNSAPTMLKVNKSKGKVYSVLLEYKKTIERFFINM